MTVMMNREGATRLGTLITPNPRRRGSEWTIVARARGIGTILQRVINQDSDFCADGPVANVV